MAMNPTTDAVSRLAVIQACPLLGIDEDRASHYQFPSIAHRCYAGADAAITLDHQSKYCLSGAYRSCPRYTTEPVAVAADADRSYRPALTVLAVPLVFAVVAVTIALAQFGGLSRPSLDGNGGVAGQPTPYVTPLVTHAPATDPSLTPSPIPALASPSATPAVIATATPPTSAPPSASTPPTANPTKEPPHFVYFVKRTDTLRTIAAKFGVRVKDIIELNDLENPDFLRNGQQLIIPRP